MTRCATLIALAVIIGIPQITSAAEPQVSHVVYFTLKESTQANKEKLFAACNQYLSRHDGTVYFTAGVLAEDLSREVNDKDFDVSLIVIFRNKAAQDKYQTHPRHLKFIAEYAELWESVRVFDSYLPAPQRKESAAQRIPLPDLAASFAGLIRGTVTQKRDRGIVVKVTAVPKQWEHSRAEQADSMIGKPVLVIPGENENARRLLRMVEVGETLSLDVAHKKGEALTLLELTEDQRQRVK